MKGVNIMKQRYIEWLQHGRLLSKNTIKSIEHDFKVFGDHLENATRFDVEMFIMQQNKQGVSTATINRRVSSIRGFFQWQIDNDFRTGKNPAAHNITPKIKNNSHESISYNELIQLYNKAPDPSLKAAIGLMGFAGMRIGEVVSVGSKNKVYEDKNGFKAIHLTDTKGGYERKVTLGLVPDIDLINNIVSDGGFKGQRGNLSENGLWRRLTNYFIKMGYKDLTPHGLRATFATISVERGARVDVVRDVMGHTTLNGNAITSRYVSVTSVEDQCNELMNTWS